MVAVICIQHEARAIVPHLRRGFAIDQMLGLRDRTPSDLFVDALGQMKGPRPPHAQS